VAKVSVPCDSCSANVGIGDDFCPSCGAEVSADLKRALHERWEASDSSAAERAKHIRSASHMIAILAALFVLGGLLMFYTSGKEATEALQQLQGLPDEMVFPEPIMGKTLTVAEVRQTVEREPYLVLGLNWLLALIMAGLFLWSRRSPFPAVIAALAVFVVVHVANAVVDPVTIVKGIILKVIAIIALVKGVRAGFAVRALERGRSAD
jgi:hypothetical protein